MKTEPVSVFAPAKINLYLHVTGRQDDGYHTLDSLAVFADIGDVIDIEPATGLEFHVQGDFAGAFTAQEKDAGEMSTNLAMRAARALAVQAGKTLECRITLTKNLPLASGLGGGSADAAAVIWGLMNFWGLPYEETALNKILSGLGADVPVCFSCRPVRMLATGTQFDVAPAMKNIPVVLVNPGATCSTAAVFSNRTGAFREQLSALPENLEDFGDLCAFLHEQGNDLHQAACALVPPLRDVRTALEKTKGCALARMSGAGATCFGLFESHAQAVQAAEDIAAAHPHWWVQAGMIGNQERF